MLRDCAPIILLALAAIGGLTWAVMALRRSLARERRPPPGGGPTGGRKAPARRARDEFVALLPETPAASARVVLEKLRTGLAELRTADGRPAAPPSIGGVTFLTPPRGVEEIVRATDERITEAKSVGTPSHVTWNAAAE